MKNVLAIQSHVVYGFAGNKSATFPMQLLGVDVWARQYRRNSLTTPNMANGQVW